MDGEIDLMVQHCETCQEHRKPPPEAPSIHGSGQTDHGPVLRLCAAFHGKNVIDAHSKWLEACPMTKITTDETVEKLRQLFAIHGLPETVVTDNGPSFTSAAFLQYMQDNGVVLIHTAPYHSASNGLAERAVQTLRKG